MKYLKFGIFILLMSIVACSTPKEEKAEEKEVNKEEEKLSNEQEETDTNQTSSEDIFGYYVGRFKPTEYNEEANDDIYPENKITISIDSLDEEKKILYGHSIVAGNKRVFEGKYETKYPGYVAKVKEPGDNPYDGEFEFEIFPKIETLKGTWKAYKNNSSVTATEYTLGKKDFKYSKDRDLPQNLYGALYNHDNQSRFMKGEFESLTGDASKINSSNTLLKKEDVENMYQGDIMVIRNAIYARHGYSFKDRKMRFIFDQIDWYMPISVNIKSELTDIEKKNIELLLRYEKHAEKFYDTFGRH